jgi:D-alanyl-D-alanine carboxypeptidase
MQDIRMVMKNFFILWIYPRKEDNLRELKRRFTSVARPLSCCKPAQFRIEQDYTAFKKQFTGWMVRQETKDRRMIATTFKRSIGFIGLWLGLAGLVPAVAWGAPPAVNTRAAVVINVSSNRTLFEHNADTQIPPASITKVLTLYLVFEAIHEGRAHLSDRVFVTEKAGRTGGSRMYIQAGTEVTLGELIKGMAVDSGNDACVAAAEHIAGSEAAFVAMMNRKARELGMTHSYFINTNGLPAKGQVTTARDMARLSMAYLHRFPESLQVHSMQSYTFNGVTQHNRNRLLGHCPGVDGLKTGWIAASGYNLLATARRGETRILVVVLGAPNPAARLAETRKLLEVAYQKVAIGSPAIELADLTSYVDPYCPLPGKKLARGKPKKTSIARKSQPPAAKRLATTKGQPHVAAKKSQPSDQVAKAKLSHAHQAGSQTSQAKAAKRHHQASTHQVPAAQQASKVTKHTSAQPTKHSSKAGNSAKSAASTGDSKKSLKSNKDTQQSVAKSQKTKGKDKTADSKKKAKPQAKKNSSQNT